MSSAYNRCGLGWIVEVYYKKQRPGNLLEKIQANAADSMDSLLLVQLGK